MSDHIREQIDLLSNLKLPDRYEPLFQRVGLDLATILVPPTHKVNSELQQLVSYVKSGEQGALVPLSGDSGAGKTTFASSAGQWQAKEFTSTLDYSGAITFEGLSDAVSNFRRTLATNDKRIIPINLDHREADPPKAEELAIMKRFLRTSPAGAYNIIFWPEVTKETAIEIGERYRKIAGAQPIQYMQIDGPPRNTWQDIAINTLRISNNFDNLEYVGVDPKTYDPELFPSLGEFLRAIKKDFNDLLNNLKSQLAKAVVLVIVFVSESNDPGILSSLTNSSRYGLLDASGLISATPESVLGKWWSVRRGLLVRAIVQLNAHALFLSPASTMSALRNCGPTPDEFFDNIGIGRAGPARAARDLGRTDIGKLILGQPLKRYEGRGNPAHDATAAFQLLGERGFNLGKDKSLNKIMAAAWTEYVKLNNAEHIKVEYEKVLDFCRLIPDNSLTYQDTAICIEYTWRKGEFLSSGYRSTVAQYILEKIRNYVREMGWSAE